MKSTRIQSRTARTIAGFASVVLLGSLAACSGDDEGSVSNPRSDDEAQSASDEPSETETQPPGDLSLSCTAKVDVTGAVTLSWKQPGEAIVKGKDSDGDGPLAFYRSSNPNGKTMVLLYSEGPNFKPSVTLSNNKRNFSSGTSEAKGLTASTDGSKVVAKNVVVTGTDGKAKAEVSATFNCGENVGQKKKDKKKN